MTTNKGVNQATKIKQFKHRENASTQKEAKSKDKSNERGLVKRTAQ